MYSNLAQCPVAKGDVVDLGTFLGTVRGGAGENAVLHFEVWKIAGDNRTPQDPRAWLTKR